jgi:hypothetical protein
VAAVTVAADIAATTGGSARDRLNPMLCDPNFGIVPTRARPDAKRHREAFFGAAMSLPLDGCWAKIERANENIKNLETEIATLVQPDPYVAAGNVNHQRKECIFVAKAKPIPLRLSVLVGEIIQHLRSSLDHVIWALALQRHAMPHPRIGFPICLTEKKFEEAKKAGIINGISGNAQTIVEHLQPYRSANWRTTASDTPLRIIHDLNNTDKHRLLAVVISAVYVTNTIHFSGKMGNTAVAQIVPEQWADLLLRTELDGTKILTVHFAKMDPELQVNAYFRHQVAFEQFGTREVEPVIPNLMLLRDATIKAIKLFEGEFS